MTEVFSFLNDSSDVHEIKNVLDSDASPNEQRRRVEGILSDGPNINEELGMLELSVARALSVALPVSVRMPLTGTL